MSAPSQRTGLRRDDGCRSAGRASGSGTSSACERAVYASAVRSASSSSVSLPSAEASRRRVTTCSRSASDARFSSSPLIPAGSCSWPRRRRQAPRRKRVPPASPRRTGTARSRRVPARAGATPSPRRRGTRRSRCGARTAVSPRGPSPRLPPRRCRRGCPSRAARRAGPGAQGGGHRPRTPLPPRRGQQPRPPRARAVPRSAAPHRRRARASCAPPRTRMRRGRYGGRASRSRARRRAPLPEPRIRKPRSRRARRPRPRSCVQNMAVEASARTRHARDLFAPLGPTYDRYASMLSFGQDPRWRSFLVSRIPPDARAVLDVASGTAAVAIELARAAPERTVVGIDQSPEMLAAGRERIGQADLNERIELREARAEDLPFADGEFDAVTFTYLLRYVDDVPATLRELARVVRPGGTVAMLEFGLPRGVWRPLWEVYVRIGLPAAGALASPSWGGVGRFLGPSIRDFWRDWPEPRLLDAWHDAGLAEVEARRLSLGGGVVVWGKRG